MNALWSGLRANLLAGTRLALFRPVRLIDFRISAGHYAMLVAASFLAWLLGGLLRVGFPGGIDSGALIVGLGQLPLVLLVCLLAATLLRDTSLTLVLAVLITATDPIFELVAVVLAYVSRVEAIASHADALNMAFLLWGVAALLRTQHVAAGWRGRRSAAAGALLVGLLLLLVLLVPRAELWSRSGEPLAQSSLELMNEEVFHLQGTLLDAQIDDLEAERSGVEDLYFVGVAPDARQPGLVDEVDSARRRLEERFDGAGRTLVLANSPATLATAPLATSTNLADALSQIGDLINADEDIVFLYLSGPASPGGMVAFNMPPLALDPLNPTMLARMLADSGIKWRVIFVSACFSGAFIEPLKDDNSLIITASDDAHASSACQPGGSSFSRSYIEGLRYTRSFVDAFARAKAAVSARERGAGQEASNPQIHLGTAMKDKLQSLQKRLESDDPNRPSVRASR